MSHGEKCVCNTFLLIFYRYSLWDGNCFRNSHLKVNKNGLIYWNTQLWYLKCDLFKVKLNFTENMACDFKNDEGDQIKAYINNNCKFFLQNYTNMSIFHSLEIWVSGSETLLQVSGYLYQVTWLLTLVLLGPSFCWDSNINPCAARTV